MVLGCSLNEARDPGTIHALATGGADVVFIDLEHNGHSIETAVDLVAHAHAAGITPLVRPPQADRAWVTRLLDGGCQSLLVPHIRSGSEVERLLELARYSPQGRRGVAMYGGAGNGYRPVPDIRAAMAWANDQVLVGVVVETPEAVEDLDAVLRPGVDLAVIGWGDLAAGYGFPDELRHPRLLAVAADVRARCADRGIAYGVFEGNPDAMAAELGAGASLVVSGGVLEFVRRGAAAAAAVVTAHRSSLEPSAVS